MQQIMKAKILAIGMVTMIGLAGCSKNEEVSAPNRDGVIGFNLTTNKTVRGSPVGATEGMQGKEFDV